jgi:anaerobic magnesium-protoporphyrin IX monomethyl ester cyclase
VAINDKEILLRSTDAAKSASRDMAAAGRPLRVLLIHPPAILGVQSLLSHVDNDGGKGIGYKPPLGILYVATTLTERTPHEVKVLDAQAENLTPENLAEAAVAFQPDVVGISAWTDFWYPAYRAGELIKQALPQAHLSYGGPHLGIFPHETLDLPFVDSVVVGDGEIPFMYLCNLISNDKLDNSLPGLHFKQFGVKAEPATFYIHADLDDLPIPDRTLLPLKNYTSVLGKSDLVTTMITSRGCPHKCTFCKLNFQKTLARSADSVVREFSRLAALGIREVEIYDDTFTWSKKRLREICEGLIAADNDITFAVRDRVSSASGAPELLDLMYRAGCRRIHFGIESGVQPVLDRMRKRISLEQASQAVLHAKSAGLTVLTYFMFGNLDETLDDMRRTVDFAIALDADYAQFSITIPYAGTEMYLEALSDGTIAQDYWLAYAINPSENFVPPQIIETHADLQQMMAIRDKAIRRFYFRPKFLYQQLKAVGSLGEFVRKARMGGQLAFSVYSK